LHNSSPYILLAVYGFFSFDNILDDYNGNITNANISASAAIATSKINTTFPSGALVGTTDTQTLTNKDLSSATNTLPTSVVTLTGTQTLTNKTLTSPTVNTARITGPYDSWVDAADGTTITFDLSAGNKQKVTLGGNRTLALSNVQNGHVFIIRLKQDATGSRTVGWFSGISWAGGTAPTLITTANKSDVFGFIQTASGAYDGFVIGQNI